MPAEEAREFDTAIEGLVHDHQRPDSTLALPTTATVVGGRPV